MLLELLRFELRHHAAQPVFRAVALGFLLLGLAGASGGFGGVGVARNGTFAVAFLITVFSLGSLFTTALFVGPAILRDHETRMAPLIFTTGVHHSPYVLSRFLGLALASTSVFAFAVLGLFLGQFMPLSNLEFGPVRPLAYLWGFCIIAVPNIILGASLIFTAAALTRNPLSAYLSGIFLYILYFVGNSLGNSPVMAGSAPLAADQAALATLLEPFGLAGLFEATRYWSIEQKNQAFVALSGSFLHNRMLWLGFSLSLFALTYRLYDFRPTLAKPAKPPKAETEPPPTPHTNHDPLPNRQNTLTPIFARTLLDLKTLCSGYPFYALILLWTFLIVMTTTDYLSGDVRPQFGLMLPALQDPLVKLGALILIFFTGELLWRERTLSIHPLIDATPTSTAVFWLGKGVALKIFAAGLLTYTFVVAAVILGLHGHLIQDAQAVLRLFAYALPPLLWVIVLAMTLSTLIPNKYAGMAASFAVVLMASGLFRSPFFENPLFRYGYLPELIYSPMVGTAYHDAALPAFALLWTGIAIVLLTLMSWRWPRGLEADGSRPSQVLVGLGLLCIIAGCALIIPQRHHFRNQDRWNADAADYERNYAHLDHPVDITRVQLRINLQPNQRRYQVQGFFDFQTDADQVLVGLPPTIRPTDISLTEAVQLHHDPRHNQYLFQPSAQAHRLTFAYEVHTSAFAELDPELYLLGDHAYLEIERALPTVGFGHNRVIRDPDERTRHDLPNQTPQPSGRDRAIFDVTVKAPDHLTVVAPGQLTGSTNEDQGKRFVTPRPVFFDFGIAAAPYVRQTQQVGDIHITLDHHPQHTDDLMLPAAATALTTFQTHFGPYPDDRLQMAQLPSFSNRFGGTAQPNTLYLVEDRSFLQKSPTTITRLIAHELAHQWFGQQLAPRLGPGARLLTEFPAIFAETLVHQQIHGDDLSDLETAVDQYFYIRGFQAEPEPPLARVEDQSHVTYFKSTHVAHALHTLMREETITVLRTMLADHPPPQLAEPDELVARLMEAAPQHKAQLDEWLNQVVTYDIALHNIDWDEGRLEIQARRHHLIDTGERKTGPLTRPLEVALFQGERYEIQTVNLQNIEQTITIEIPKEIDRIELDPRHLLLEVDRSDNQGTRPVL